MYGGKGTTYGPGLVSLGRQGGIQARIATETQQARARVQVQGTHLQHGVFGGKVGRPAHCERGNHRDAQLRHRQELQREAATMGSHSDSHAVTLQDYFLTYSNGLVRRCGGHTYAPNLTAQAAGPLRMRPRHANVLPAAHGTA